MTTPPNKSRALDQVHFAFAGLVIGVYAGLEIAFSMVPTAHAEGPNWLLFTFSAISICFSIVWSIRMIREKKVEAWIYLCGNVVYTAVLIGITIYALRLGLVSHK
jgi:hypothetical protein